MYMQYSSTTEQVRHNSMRYLALNECGKSEVRLSESEALIQRLDLLLERISKMNYEVEKIDQRMAFLQRAA
jgi:hypothetical protein